MKTNQLKYESPAVEILEVAVEQGFALSAPLPKVPEYESPNW